MAYLTYNGAGTGDGVGESGLKFWLNSLGREKELTEDELKERLHRFVQERTEKYPTVIMDPMNTQVPRLKCPRFPAHLYEHLKAAAELGDKELYFFALNLRQCHRILRRLMGSIVEVMRFLGPRNVVLSIVEGNSDDGTAEVLRALKDDLEALGIVFYYQHSDINSNAGDRIFRLAELRNLALEPLINSRKNGKTSAGNGSLEGRGAGSTQVEFVDATTLVFVNDVAICPDDLLELIHQRKIQEADMTCGMDWSWTRKYSPFYDVWVARQINGDTFFDIDGETGNWVNEQELFPRDPPNRARYDAMRLVQVFSCWNGGIAVTAKPFLDGDVRFRDKNEGECQMGEPTTTTRISGKGLRPLRHCAHCQRRILGRRRQGNQEKVRLCE